MTLWSIPMCGIRGKRPLKVSKEWKPEFMNDSRLILNGESHQMLPTQFPGVYLSHCEYNGEEIESKFQGSFDFQYLSIYLPTTYCEIIIDDSKWQAPIMPDYPHHNEQQKLQTVMFAGATLIQALRLIGFNQFISPCILKNGTISLAKNCEESSIELFPHQGFVIPMPPPVGNKTNLSEEDYNWLLYAHSVLYNLSYETDLTPVFSAIDYCYQDMPPRAKMTIIWAAIEHLVKPNPEKIRFGIRSRSAMLIGRTDEEIQLLYKQIGNLYGKRSAATHGRKFTYNKGLEINLLENQRLVEDLESLSSSYKLLCEILIKIIDRESMYSELELQKLEDEFQEKFPQ